MTGRALDGQLSSSSNSYTTHTQTGMEQTTMCIGDGILGEIPQRMCKFLNSGPHEHVILDPATKYRAPDAKASKSGLKKLIHGKRPLFSGATVNVYE